MKYKHIKSEESDVSTEILTDMAVILKKMIECGSNTVTFNLTDDIVVEIRAIYEGRYM